MANATLFASSVVSGIIHWMALACFDRTPPLLKQIILVGIATSIWNHGTTSTLAKVADRVAMLVGFAVDVMFAVLLSNYFCMWLLCGAVGFYFIAKQSCFDVYHVFAHLILTMAHLILIQKIQL